MKMKVMLLIVENSWQIVFGRTECFEVLSKFCQVRYCTGTIAEVFSVLDSSLTIYIYTMASLQFPVDSLTLVTVAV